VFETVKQLQTGICAGLGNQNAKLMKSLYGLLTKMMSVISSDSLGGAARSVEDLDILYPAIVKTVTEGMANFDKYFVV